MNRIAQSEAAANEIWRQNLLTIHTVFGRLVWLSSLYNARTRQYEHFVLAQAHGAEATNRAMREAHRRIFAEWLCFNLREQWEDLDLYLGSLTLDRRLVLRAWDDRTTYATLIPHDAGDAERRLFFCDFEVIIAVMRTGCQAAGAESAFQQPLLLPVTTPPLRSS